MKSALIKAVSLAALFTLVGCATTMPSENQRRFYKECAMNPPQTPCGYY